MEVWRATEVSRYSVDGGLPQHLHFLKIYSSAILKDMAAKPTLNDIESLVGELVVPFYHIERDMDIPGKKRRRESDAEHSWSLAFVACCLAHEIDPKLDLGLIAQLAIAHDVLEVYAGDVSIWDSQDKLSKKKANEVRAINKIAERFAHFPWLSKAIEMYEQQENDEAKFVYALDKFLPLIVRRLDNGQGFIDKKLTREAFLEGIRLNRSKAETYPEIGWYFDELLSIFQKHPEYFYQP